MTLQELRDAIGPQGENLVWLSTDDARVHLLPAESEGTPANEPALRMRAWVARGTANGATAAQLAAALAAVAVDPKDDAALRAILS